MAGASITRIEKRMKAGKQCYEINFMPAGGKSELEVAPSGQLICRSQMVAEKDLPAPVKSTVDKEAAGGAIKELEKVVRDGRTSYDLEFMKAGKTHEITVGPDGKLITQPAK